MKPERSTYWSASSNASTVRPRNRRLVSYGDENDPAREGAGNSTSWSQSKSRSPSTSRGASPIPGAHPSRPPSTAADAGSVASTGCVSRRNNRGHSIASSGLGLWESWSSLQSIASTLLGTDAQPTTKDRSGATFNASEWTRRGKVSRPHPIPQWGPETSSAQNYTAGSKEERQAMILAKKREALLLADVNDFSNSAPTKRRGSDPRLSNSVTSAEQDGDVLVYVHQVQPQDTLAGVIIRYQCQPVVFRKVNRLWPNDNIQIREHVFLPVEACAIRGKKINTIGPVSEHDISITPASELFKHSSSNTFNICSDSESPSLPLNTIPKHDPEYKHEYFVSIPGIPKNVETARITRRILGFFPPSRRKPQTFSDTDTFLDSPKASLDLPSRLNPISLNASPSRNRPSRPHRSGSGSCFADRLRGPGGVGTLRGSGLGGVANPGPAEDSLNKMFAHHLPSVAPRESFDSVHSASSTRLENVGGVIEEWVRKVGTKLSGSIEPTEAYKQQSRMGDLIELESSTDVIEGHGGAGGGLGQHEGVLCASALDAPVSGRSSRELPKGKGATGATGTEEALLRERFPPRGRMVDAQTNRRR